MKTHEEFPRDFEPMPLSTAKVLLENVINIWKLCPLKIFFFYITQLLSNAFDTFFHLFSWTFLFLWDNNQSKTFVDVSIFIVIDLNPITWLMEVVIKLSNQGNYFPLFFFIDVFPHVTKQWQVGTVHKLCNFQTYETQSAKIPELDL